MQGGGDDEGHDGNPVIAIAGVDINRLHTHIGDQHAVAQGAAVAEQIARQNGTDAAIDVHHQAIGIVGAGNEQTVAAVGSRGIDDNAGRAVGWHGDQVILRRAAVVASVVQHCLALPVDHGDEGVRGLGITDRVVGQADAAIQIVDDNRVVACPAIDPGFFKDVLQVFNNRVGGEVVAAAVQQGSDNQLVVVQAHIGIAGVGTVTQVFDQGVVVAGSAGIKELVQTHVTGDKVAAQTAVKNVVKFRSAQGVVAFATDQGQRRMVRRQRKGVDGVIALLRRDNQAVALRTHGVSHLDRRKSGGKYQLDAIGSCGFLQRHDIVAGVVAKHGNGVGGRVV